MDSTTIVTTAHPAPRRSAGAALLLQRWPTVAALAFALFGTPAEASVDVLTEMMMLLPFLYLVTAVLGRPRAVWVVFPVSYAAWFVLRALDVVPSTVLIGAAAAVVVVVGAVRGRLRDRRFLVQVAGMAAFGVLGLVALAVDPDLARYLVAAGWFLHGVWDLVHHRLRSTVDRSFAEFCAVLDVAVAVALVLV
ncbi:hypothetical protein [Rhodococcus rhodochrous]|uniref:Uncharacterized protein n=1 Tax=Rhodococcus rhodochrous KG-21 TaxID=1441923 RepID=A0A0M9WPC3_RHORH|nr:hypothetical protein [Rhodococcus rhodochrous]KOS56550.1 hypothetical protein Z051_08745 [Rhodococcus rhodochrous KG-21]